MRANPDAGNDLLLNERRALEAAEAAAKWTRRMVQECERGDAARGYPRLLGMLARLVADATRAALAASRREPAEVARMIRENSGREASAHRLEFFAAQLRVREKRAAEAWATAEALDRAAKAADNHQDNGWRAQHFTEQERFKRAALPEMRSALLRFDEAQDAARGGDVHRSQQLYEAGVSELGLSMSELRMGDAWERARFALEQLDAHLVIQ